VGDDNNDEIETFIIRLQKSDNNDIKNINTESLIKSLLQKGNFFRVEEIVKSGKRGKIIS
jgi:hypothetical protein